MIDLKKFEVWFVTGSQSLYGPETLQEVAAHSQEIARTLDQSKNIPVRVVFKPVLTTPDAIRDLCLEANAAKDCIGLITWMHTFSPAKMWIAGLTRLQKPLAHLHTQFNRELPWGEIDMDFMNLNQSAHGDREYGFIGARLRLNRKIVVGYWQDPEVAEELAGWARAALALAREARRQGVKHLVAVAFEGETEPALASLVDDIVWLKVGQLSKMIAAFTDRGVKQCVMVGQIAPRNLFEVRPDLRAMALLFRLKERNAHTVFGAIADELKRDGVELIEATPWLQPLMPAVGFQLGPKLSAAQREDVDFGLRLAKEVSRLEIGQTVVVKEGTILAIEAFEGTDKCLARGGELAGPKGGAVAVKVAREKHDFRFDIPCVGPQTLETCAAARIGALAFEAGKSLLLEQEACARLAKQHKIAVAAVG